MELKDFIRVYDNTVDLRIISSFLQYCNILNFNKATVVGETGDELKEDARKTKTWFFQKNSYTDVHWKNYWNYTINNLFKQYESIFNQGTSTTKICSLEVLKYEPGGFYTEHTDNHTSFPRTLSLIYFLNNDFEGGDLIFHNPTTSQKFIMIPPAPGRAVIFPSNFLYPHSVSEVNKTRYVLVSWKN
tara:strand:+ start:120 stop:680 length:561 start_codon:yes stop_codon:yes gene_type:complete